MKPCKDVIKETTVNKKKIRHQIQNKEIKDMKVTDLTIKVKMGSVYSC